LGAIHMVLFALTIGLGILTVVAGRATVLTGSVHLVVFACYLFTAVVP
jgi:Ca2+:H+ antiporter